MKITISRQDLLDTVNRVKSVVSGKSALPILSHILLETGPSQVRLAATDLKTTIEATVDCTVEKQGAVTVSAQRIGSMLSEMPNEDITLHLTENNVIDIRCGKIQTKLFSLSAEEFPPVRGFDGIDSFNIQEGVLKRLFEKCSFAICSDQARYNLTGMLVELLRGKLTVVATDGRRMSLAAEVENIPMEAEAKVIIPSKAIHELERLLGGEGNCQVMLDESHAAFSFGRTRLVTAIIEGNFPNYEMVVPKKHDKEAVLDTAKFTEAMRRTRTMTNDKFNSVRVGLSDGWMTLKVVTPEVGEYTEEIPAEYSGENIEIAFNPEFVLDVLKHCGTEKVCLVMKDAQSPGVLKPYSDAPIDTYVNVVMPIRI